jgi:hypothetical protein
LREGEADEAVSAVPAICSSVIAFLGVSSAIVGYVDVALEIETWRCPANLSWAFADECCC